jgi:hypothetical protein
VAVRGSGPSEGSTIDGTARLEATEMLSRGWSAGEGGMFGDGKSSATDVRPGNSAADPWWKGGCFGAGTARASSSEWRRMSVSLAMLPRRRRNGMAIVWCDRHNPSGKQDGRNSLGELWELGENRKSGDPANRVSRAGETCVLLGTKNE